MFPWSGTSSPLSQSLLPTHLGRGRKVMGTGKLEHSLHRNPSWQGKEGVWSSGSSFSPLPSECILPSGHPPAQDRTPDPALSQYLPAHSGVHPSESRGYNIRNQNIRSVVSRPWDFTDQWNVKQNVNDVMVKFYYARSVRKETAVDEYRG